ncbi:MAG TPA: CRISPR-associated helicase Cas3' [Desulfitobacteriaceae bacterium]|nr:CRISPR-associated helicase Cas3' [Desulfitobacteriaceae bacterium]
MDEEKERKGIDESALAKSQPKEDIQAHTDGLLRNLKILKELYPNLFAGWDKFKLYELLWLACLYHDMGKLYPRFQYCIARRIPYDGIPHGLLSLAFIDWKRLKQERGLDNDDLKILYHAVAYHHARKMPLSNKEIEAEFSKLQKGWERFEYSELPWKSEIEEEINQRYFSVRERIGKKNQALFFRFVILEGLLIRLDYAASAHVEVEHPCGFLAQAMDELMVRWSKSYPGSQWNDLQLYMGQNRDKNVIAIAQTGMGKTEAGLLWLGNAKGFFTLPLKSAINAIYQRIVNDIVIEKKDERVGLLHSDTYTQYLQLNEGNSKGKRTKGKGEEGDMPADLYFTRTKQFSLPLTVCTLDQLFDFVFLYWGFERKLATLAYSKIIIDEVQMYSPELMAYLVLGLRYLTGIGGRFAILTATLPTFFIDLLKEEGIPFKPPRTFTDGRIRHSLKVIDKEINGEDIVELSRQYQGKKILVICNTVKSAVNLYRQLQWDQDLQEVKLVDVNREAGLSEDRDGEREVSGVNLLHSCFIKRDRREKERLILKMGEKDSTLSGVWIATQIVEASLDIDFDLLFTELSDLNGLFQRMGRCYRKRELKKISYNCFVFTGGNKPCSGVGAFIDQEIHRLSKAALSEMDGILGEARKVEMIERLYTKENLPDYYSLIKEVNLAYADCCSVGEISASEARERFRNIDNVTVMPHQVYETYRQEIAQAQSILQMDYSGITEAQIRELKESKAKARNMIMDYTVDISRLWYRNLEMNHETLELNRYERIPIVKCDYNSQEGMIRPTPKKNADFTDFSSRSF